ncbi:nuclear transport factor 2 family protein [Lentzea alba]|uniref:nuclear transport factor 2 family protein n=1 Tax=Lentzea alba TaxID=2714351 RepID=UPI0039BF647E
MTTVDTDTRRSTNLETLREYFRLLGERDLDGWIRLWAPDCVLRLPYTAGDLPARLDGAAAVQEFYQRVIDGFSSVTFTLIEFSPLQDPDKVFARWRPRCAMLDGSVYTNETVGLFEFGPDGLIHHFTEYLHQLGFVDSFDSFRQ